MYFFRFNEMICLNTMLQTCSRMAFKEKCTNYLVRKHKDRAIYQREFDTCLVQLSIFRFISTKVGKCHMKRNQSAETTVRATIAILYILI